MMTMRMRAVTGVAALALVVGSGETASGQQDAHDWQARCDSRSNRATVCEVRETRVAATGEYRVNARPNGGVRVQAWDGNEVLVQARVQTHAGTASDARDIASRINVEVTGRQASASGPRARGQQGWSVSYDVFVPRRTNLSLESVNGGLRVTDVVGDLEASTTNGGINLTGVSGSVRGSSTNGGISVRVIEPGTGIDLRTTNGGITLELPRGYAANLEGRTVNGGISTNLPVQVEGRRRSRVEAQISGGGPTVRLRTTNGGIRINSQ